MTRAIADTGPLVAFFDRSERHHSWVAECVEALNAPLLVCEAVLTEASYLLSRFPKAQDTLLELVESGTLAVAFRVEGHVDELRKLLHKSATRRCRSLTPVSCAWPRCTTATPS